MVGNDFFANLKDRQQIESAAGVLWVHQLGGVGPESCFPETADIIRLVRSGLAPSFGGVRHVINTLDCSIFAILVAVIVCPRIVEISWNINTFLCKKRKVHAQGA